MKDLVSIQTASQQAQEEQPMAEVMTLQEILDAYGSELDGSPSVYCGTYRKYNEGSIFGAWLDIAKFDSYDEFIDVCRQLHGDEDDEYILEIKKFSNLPIIKAYRDSIYANYRLYDNLDPGKGNVFDWNLIKNNKPFFLAGGINIDNVDDAKKLNPFCIDVSSSVETDGFKDYIKMRDFIRKCKNE